MFQSKRKGGGISLRAPCKINLHLSIGGRRPDGFHALESVFTALDFADTLTFALMPGQDGETTLTLRAEAPFLELSRSGILPPIPPEKNLVCRAAELFRAKTGFSRNLAVELVKRVPPGSGLGGGSSDAAAALLALNVLAGEFLPRSFTEGKKSQRSSYAFYDDASGPLSREDLLELAARLGSDVPFFVRIAGLGESPACVAGGRGELLESLPPPPPLGVLLVFPGFASDTAAAYKLLDARQKTARPLSGVNFAARIAPDGSWPPPETWNFSNDFLDLFLNYGTEREKNAYQTILKDLREAGAVFSGFSGSGSACFGIFPGLESAEKARQKFSGAFYALKTTFLLHSEKTGSKIK